MNIFIRILICAVIATVTSAFYSGWQNTGSFSFAFNGAAAVWFFAASLLCLFATSISIPAPSNSSGKPSATQKKASSASPIRKQSNGQSRETGSVKWFNGNKGFGFITCENGDEIFVHFRSVRKDSKRLTPGSPVEFDIVEGKKGFEAEDVVVL